MPTAERFQKARRSANALSVRQSKFREFNATAHNIVQISAMPASRAQQYVSQRMIDWLSGDGRPFDPLTPTGMVWS